MIGKIYTEFTESLSQAVDRVCSSLYRETFEKVVKEQPNVLSNEQRILIIDYPNMITWYRGDKRPEIIERIRGTHLKWFNDWLSKHNTGRPPYVRWNAVMVRILLHLKNMFFRIDFGDIITDDSMRDTFRQIADTIKSILLSISESNPKAIDQAALPLVQELLQILFYFTLDSDLVIYLKSLPLVDLLHALLQTSNDVEIHLHAYRILAVIITENDIIKLQNSNEIAHVFITTLANVIDGGDQMKDRLHNTLRSLKVLTQHDQIREELIKQGGHSLFLRCVLEEQFNPIKAKLPALEILLALAFNHDFTTTLKDNTTFMNHLRTLISSPDEDLKRVATALIWKLEKESETIIKKVEDQSYPTSVPTLVKKQYDIMISYSHNDKKLCHRILNVLEKDQFNVWVDSQLMHGATFDAMAEAIENTEFVLICMSDAYKQSSFCKTEANYAVKRLCHLIPLVMTPNYKADGWLGVLTSPYIYIDFPKLGFDRGYEELKKQIELYRRNNANSTVMKQNQVHDSCNTLVNIIPKPFLNGENKDDPHPVVDYPHCIDMWTKDHVKSFLLDKDLDIFLPAFEGMNGRLLHKIYSMCQDNQQGMFLSLKEDVVRSQHKTILSLKDYVTFLEEIKLYVPYTAANPLNPTSTVCSLM